MQRVGRVRVFGLAFVVVLLAAMMLNTKFVTPQELADVGPEKFDPQKTAEALFTQAGTEIGDRAAPLGEVIAGVQSDPAAAAEEFDAVSPGADSFVFAVTATGIVTEASADSVQLKVQGVPAQTTVIVPVTTAINGTVLRDGMGFEFADAPGQSAFQFVGDELKKLMQAAVADGVGNPGALKGKTVTVVGVLGVVGAEPQPAAKPVNIQPVSMREGS